MSKWRKTINIKDAMSDDVSASGIKKAADTIMGRLSGSGAPYAKLEKARDMAGHDPETALLVFNDGMDRLYDWADDNSVWLA